MPSCPISPAARRSSWPLPAPGRSRSADPPSPAPAPAIVKPLPPEWFIDYGTNAEMRWEAMQGQPYLVSNERFFVRNHTATPAIDMEAYRLPRPGPVVRGGPRPFPLGRGG